MEWQSESIVLNSKKFSEDSRILTTFSEAYGKSSGILKNIRQSVQIGDLSHITWRGRNFEKLGTLKIENIFSPFAYVIENALGLFALQSACALCSKGLPEKAPHKNLFKSLKSLFLSLKYCEFNECMLQYIFFEIDFLKEMGFGLDFSKCAVTGKRENLYYLSPRTGKAATKAVGEAYKDKLFVIPKFFLSNVPASRDDILNALKIISHFLKHAFLATSTSGELPEVRLRLIEEFESAEVESLPRKTLELECAETYVGTAVAS